MRRAISSRDGSASHHPAATAAYKHGTRKRSSDPARHFRPRALTKDDPCYALGIRDALPEPTRLEDASSSWASNASRAHRPEEYLHDGAEGRRGSNLEGRRRPAWEAFWGLAGAKAFRRWPCFCVDDANRTAAVAAAGIRAVSGSQDPVAANRTTDERASTR